jgi:soluble lytic murein transglycosylase-like protein
MHRDRLHIIFIPQGPGRLKKFALPRFLTLLAVGSLFASTFLMTYVLYAYWSAKQVDRQLTRLERENHQQKDQLVRMAAEISKLADKLTESQKLTGHGEAVNALKETIRSLSSREEKADLLESAQYENMIRQMHHGLDYLHTEISALGLLRHAENLDFALYPDESSGPAVNAKKAALIYKRTLIKSRLRTIARELGLAPRLALGMAQVESGFDHGAVSPRGAIGVLQVTPRLAGDHFEIPPEMLFDPEVNIRVGLLHMKSLLERFDDDLDLSLAAYNAGVTRVVHAGYRVPSIPETKEYVKKVKEAMNDYAALSTLEQ